LVHFYFTVTQYQTYEKIQDGGVRHTECRLLAIFPWAMNKMSVIFVPSVYYKNGKKNQNGGEMKFEEVLTETNLHSFFRYGVQQKTEYTTGHRDITLSHGRRVSQTMTGIRRY